MESIMKVRDPEMQGGSFSFSTRYDDFNSSALSFFSDDDEDSYIELAFEAAKTASYSDSSDLELRISFSSSIPLPPHDHNISKSSENANQFEFVTRKSSNTSGTMMKFLIKFRSMNLGALIASFMKPPQQVFSGCKRRENSKSLIKSPFVVSLRGQNGSGGVRGMLGLVGSKFDKTARILKGNSSSKSSPIHQGTRSSSTTPSTDPSKLYARENSIQAAIAHCKTSFR
ncbi:hypothetical protein ACFE04_026989 [Oxalis oulophora]